MPKITVIASLKAKTGKEKELEEALLAMIEPTRQEAGCLNYDLHCLHDADGEFLFHENWENQDYLNAHFETEHFLRLHSQVDELTAEAPIIKLYRHIR